MIQAFRQEDRIREIARTKKAQRCFHIAGPSLLEEQKLAKKV